MSIIWPRPSLLLYFFYARSEGSGASARIVWFVLAFDKAISTKLKCAVHFKVRTTL